MLGRSRRAAFICGVLGVILADIAVAVINWLSGVETTLRLGAAGAMDTVVISGLLAVLFSELAGELLERAARASGREPSATVDTPFRKRGGRA